MTDIERLREIVEKYAGLPIVMAMSHETDAPPVVIPPAGAEYEVALAIREVGAEIAEALYRSGASGPATGPK